MCVLKRLLFCRLFARTSLFHEVAASKSLVFEKARSEMPSAGGAVTYLMQKQESKGVGYECCCSSCWHCAWLVHDDQRPRCCLFYFATVCINV